MQLAIKVYWVKGLGDHINCPEILIECIKVLSDFAFLERVAIPKLLLITGLKKNWRVSGRERLLFNIIYQKPLCLDSLLPVC